MLDGGRCEQDSDLRQENPSWVSVARTHKGNYRRCNEDAVVNCAHNSIWAVADGMGGHDAGDLASQAIAAALVDANQCDRAELSAQSQMELVDRVDWIEDQLLLVDSQLHKHAATLGPGTVIGSTVVSLTLDATTGVVLWAGDSRLYRLRAGRLDLVTRDHNPVVDLLDVGAVSEEEALATDTNVVTRAVGGAKPLDLDVAVFDVAADDTLLLCSDGLYRELQEWEMIELLGQTDLNFAADQLVDRVLAGQARDNLSLVLLRNASHDVG